MRFARGPDGTALQRSFRPPYRTSKTWFRSGAYVHSARASRSGGSSLTSHGIRVRFCFGQPADDIAALTSRLMAAFVSRYVSADRPLRKTGAHVTVSSADSLTSLAPLLRSLRKTKDQYLGNMVAKNY